MHKKDPVVSIIVVTYDEWELSEACLRSLAALSYPRDRFEVVLVDNGSHESSHLQAIADEFTNLTVIRNIRNEGFVRAVNRGMRHARSDAAYYALVNNDSVVAAGWLRAMVQAMEVDPRAGCCGAREESYGNRVAIRRLAFEGNWMGGGSVIYRKAALDEVGLFDEFYFAYCEDIDLSWRMKMRGWKVICAPEAVWYHHGAGRTMKENDPRLFLSMRNRLYLLLKFASCAQIYRSLKRYACNMFAGRRTEKGTGEQEPAGAVTVRHSAKSRYALRALWEVGCALPGLFSKRRMIHRTSQVPSAQIDDWIRANDAYESLNF